MSANCFAVQKLPDIEIYGGDTTPWEVELMRDSKTAFDYADGTACRVVLTFTPIKVSTGLGSNASALPPVLTNIGTIQTTATGGSVVVFSFTSNQTKDLRGKYIYQLEVTYNNECRVGQGIVYVKQNINR